MTEILDNGASPLAPVTHLHKPRAPEWNGRAVTTGTGSRSCSRMGNVLVVVLSMLVASSASITATAAPASASANSLWSELNPAANPAVLSGASIVYDPATRQSCCSMATPTAQPRRGHGPGAALLGPRSARRPAPRRDTPPLPVSSTQITATTPVELAGTVDVTVGTPPARVPPALLTSSVTRRSPSSVLSAQCQGCRRGCFGSDHRQRLQHRHRGQVRRDLSDELPRRLVHPDHCRRPCRGGRHRRRHGYQPLRYERHELGRRVRLRGGADRHRRQPGNRAHDGGTAVAISAPWPTTQSRPAWAASTSSPPTGGRCVRPSATGGARLLVKAASSTDLNLSATELIYGDEQVEHVSVGISSPAPGSQPSGSVTISESGITLCTIKLSTGTASCRLSAKQLPVDAYSVVASYGGSGSSDPPPRATRLRIVAELPPAEAPDERSRGPAPSRRPPGVREPGRALRAGRDQPSSETRITAAPFTASRARSSSVVRGHIEGVFRRRGPDRYLGGERQELLAVAPRVRRHAHELALWNRCRS